MLIDPSKVTDRSLIRRTPVPEPYLGVKLLDPRAKLPEKAHVGDLGYDLFALEDVELVPNAVTKVRTGIACNFPEGYGALIWDRSSVATKKEVFRVAGVIDQGYTGEIIVALYNPGIAVLDKQLDFWRAADNGEQLYTVHGVYYEGQETILAGEKIAQLVLTQVINFPVREVKEIVSTNRGSNGFGSTGK